MGISDAEEVVGVCSIRGLDHRGQSLSVIYSSLISPRGVTAHMRRVYYTNRGAWGCAYQILEGVPRYDIVNGVTVCEHGVETKRRGLGCQIRNARCNIG